MPKLGEIIKNNNRDNLIWLACFDCGTERWVKVADARKPNFTGLCHTCCLLRRNGKLAKSPNWRGGIKHVNGYIFVYIWPMHPFHVMADALGYVKRSRLIMAQYLGRPLTSQEEVHHEDEIRDHDDLENLRLFSSRAEHQDYHRRKELLLRGARPRNIKGQFIKGGYGYAYQRA